MFAIKVCDDVKIVRHLPMEIPRLTKYLLDRGAVFIVELTSTNYRRSPLIQGGLKIPVKVTVTMLGTVKNHLLMENYKEIVNERYAEPKDEEVLGSFLALPPVGQACKRDTRSEKSTKRGRKTKENHHGQGQDIRQLFRKIAEKNEGEIDMVVEKGKNKTNTDRVTITIDWKDI